MARGRRGTSLSPVRTLCAGACRAAATFTDEEGKLGDVMLLAQSHAAGTGSPTTQGCLTAEPTPGPRTLNWFIRGDTERGGKGVSLAKPP